MGEGQQHGRFTASAAAHLYGEGCRTCAFITQSKKMHGDFYDYANCLVTDYDTKVKIVCPIHGEFEQLYDNHQKGYGCRKCRDEQTSVRKAWTTELFIEKAKEVHGDKFDYSLVEYTGSQDKVTLICKEHGKFLTTPSNHINNKSGCSKCGQALQRVAFEEFVRRAKSVHDEKYEYDEDSYKGIDDKTRIRCSKHGWFWQRAKNHIELEQGCSDCGRARQLASARAARHDSASFVEMAEQIHGKRYDYSESVYTTRDAHITVKCRVHGPFLTTPNIHLQAKGCPKCSLSKSEAIIAQWLDEKSIEYEVEYSFPDCRDKQPLRFDFYIPSEKILIEFDGEQHSRVVKGMGTKVFTKQEAREKFLDTQRKDKIKNDWCEKNGYRLIRIPHHAVKQIRDILTSEFADSG